ncbi:MAG TPA: type IV pilus assembly protein PilM [Candidatus Pacearchaeota archaeon]|nr:type IV pilus assembly protein PilM [Candidatus Pacearchaeota archaeon]HOL90613.1 type IV pilus assembly protein PilM [Candidatus Pacearchaeota archaeon]
MFKNIFNIKLKKQPNKFLGIDIGSFAIKIIEIGKKNNTFSLENYGELQISTSEENSFREFKEDVLSLSNNEIAEAILAILKEAKINTKDVNFSIPDFSSFFTVFNLPLMNKNEIQEAIKYEIRPYVPLPLSEITVDWNIIEGKVGQTPLKVLGVAIPNNIIAQYQEIANLCNLTLHSLEPEVFSLGRSLNPLLVNSKQTIALLDIGARSTTFNIFEKGILTISHSFNIGSNDLTERLVKSLNISYNEAEEIKKFYGLLPDKELDISIKDILLPLIDVIINEAKKVFREYFKQEGKEIEKIILGGGSALLPGLKEYFLNETKKETEIANPFLSVAYNPILGDILKKNGPSYAVAVGLSLKGFE